MVRLSLLLEDTLFANNGTLGFMKTCYKCKHTKPVEDFRSNAKSGYIDSYCRPCRNSYEKNRYASMPKVKKHWLEGKTEEEKLRLRRQKSARRRYNRYGLNLEELTARLEAQYGGCAVCSTPLTLDSHDNAERVKVAHVDHTHTTGQVRGILCSKCNHALGLLDEDESRILSLLAYVKDYSS